MSAKVLTASLFALLIGVIAGLRTITAPAAVSWAAQSGRLALGGTWLAFLGYAWTPWILAGFALLELVGFIEDAVAIGGALLIVVALR
jgi:uncharacterized membrane protein